MSNAKETWQTYLMPPPTLKSFEQCCSEDFLHQVIHDCQVDILITDFRITRPVLPEGSLLHQSCNSHGIEVDDRITAGSVFLELSVTNQAQTFSSKPRILFFLGGIMFSHYDWYFFFSQRCPQEPRGNSLENVPFWGWDTIAYKHTIMAGSNVGRQ